MLEERINKDYIVAMKARDSVRSSAINYLRAMIKQVKVDSRLESLDDAGVIVVLRKQIKQRQDSIEQFVNGGRPELADKEQVEIDIMKVYLPQEMSVDDINDLIVQVMQETGASSMKDMGNVMKLVRERAAGRADGKVVSDLVKEKLASL